MKTFNIFFTILITLFSVSANAQKQGAKRETVKVYGSCEMCQSRIEKAAKSAGASFAKWDVDSKILSVSYNPAKASVNSIEKSIAAAGYNTEHVKASEEAYNKLPECCQYDMNSKSNSDSSHKSE